MIKIKRKIDDLENWDIMVKEGIKRSLTKSISYRIICIVMLAIVSYIFTGNLSQVTGIVIVFQAIQMVIYYIHERAWERIKWGYV